MGGLLTKLLVLVPLTAAAAVIFGFGFYNTACKNVHVALFDC